MNICLKGSEEFELDDHSAEPAGVCQGLSADAVAVVGRYFRRHGRWDHRQSGAVFQGTISGRHPGCLC